MKKLLVLHPSLAPYRIDFFNELNANFKAKFYFYYPNVLDQKFNQDALKKQLNFRCSYLKKGIHILGRPLKFGVFSKIKAFNPEIILCAEYSLITLYVVVLNILFKTKFKIYTLCDDSVSMSKNTSLLRALFRRYLLKKLCGVILTNKEIVNWYHKNLDVRCKLITFPIIVDEIKFIKKLHTVIPNANTIIDTYKLENNKVILFVGRLVEVKNLPNLIKIFNLVKLNNSKLVLVGSGKEGVHLKALVNALNLQDYVIFTGRQEGINLLSWYVATNTFILASKQEAFGAVVNEALISGSFILCSKLAGANCLITAKQNGLLFDPNNEKEFETTLKMGLELSKPILKIKKLSPPLMPFSFQSKIIDLITKLDFD